MKEKKRGRRQWKKNKEEENWGKGEEWRKRREGENEG